MNVEISSSNNYSKLHLIIKGKEYKILKSSIASEAIYNILQVNLSKFRDKSSSKILLYVLPKSIERRGFDIYLNILINDNCTVLNTDDIIRGLIVSNELSDYKSSIKLINNYKINITNNVNYSKTNYLYGDIKLIIYLFSQLKLNDNNPQLINEYNKSIEFIQTKIIEKIFFNNLYDNVMFQDIFEQLAKLPEKIIESITIKCFRKFLKDFKYNKKYNNNILEFLLIKLLLKCLKINNENSRFLSNKCYFDNIYLILNLSVDYYKNFNMDENCIQWDICLNNNSNMNINLNKNFNICSNNYILDSSFAIKLYASYNKSSDELMGTYEVLKDNNSNNKNYYPLFFNTKTFLNNTNINDYNSFAIIYPLNYTKKRNIFIRIDNFSKKIKDTKTYNGILSLKINYSINYFYSVIIYYICSNFELYYSNKNINKLQLNNLYIILKNSLCHLNDTYEDKVMDTVINWINYKKEMYTTLDNDSINILMDCFSIEKISMDCLINIIINHGSIFDSYPDSIGKVIKKEINRRLVDIYKYQNDSIISSLQNESNNDEEKSSSRQNNQERFTSELIDKIISISNSKKANSPIKSNSLNLNTTNKNSSNNTAHGKQKYIKNYEVSLKSCKSNITQKINLKNSNRTACYTYSKNRSRNKRMINLKNAFNKSNTNTNSVTSSYTNTSIFKYNTNTDENLSLFFPSMNPKENKTVLLSYQKVNYNKRNSIGPNKNNCKHNNPSLSINSSNSQINTQYLISTNSVNNGIISTDNSSIHSRNTNKNMIVNYFTNLHKNTLKYKLDYSYTVSPNTNLSINTYSNDLSNLVPNKSSSKKFSDIIKKSVNSDFSNYKSVSNKIKINNIIKYNNNFCRDCNVNNNKTLSNKLNLYICNNSQTKKDIPKLMNIYFSPQNYREKGNQSAFLKYHKKL